jgi:hypothetical protein
VRWHFAVAVTLLELTVRRCVLLIGFWIVACGLGSGRLIGGTPRLTNCPAAPPRCEFSAQYTDGLTCTYNEVFCADIRASTTCTFEVGDAYAGNWSCVSQLSNGLTWAPNAIDCQFGCPDQDAGIETDAGTDADAQPDAVDASGQ